MLFIEIFDTARQTHSNENRSPCAQIRLKKALRKSTGNYIYTLANGDDLVKMAKIHVYFKLIIAF